MPVLVRAAFAILAVSAVAGTLDVLGVAGYQGGEIAVAAVLAATAGAGGWFSLRGVPAAGLWAAVVAVLATLLTPVLVDRAPWSAGRLQAELDSLELGFVDRIDQHVSGHSWCKPTCPVVERTYLGPAVNALVAIREVGVALSAADLAPRAATRDIRTTTFGLEHDHVRIDVRTEPDDPADPVSRIRITIRLESRR